MSGHVLGGVLALAVGVVGRLLEDPSTGPAGPLAMRGDVAGVPSRRAERPSNGAPCPERCSYGPTRRKKTLAGSDPCDWLKKAPKVVPIDVSPS